MSKNYSIILQTKIPSFIRDDPEYSRLIQFFEAYYTWFNDTYHVTEFDKNLDIDTADGVFLDYFKADFLPHFPDNIETDVVKLIKIVKQLYQSKGIPDSFKFLFRAIYNKSVEIFPTRDEVLRASDGKWIAPKSIKINSTDINFRRIDNFSVYGETSKTVGVIQSSKLNGKFTQIYFSDIQRLFFSGETIRIIDASGKDVYFLNGVYSPYDTEPNPGSVLLTSKIIGSLSSINITTGFRGTSYRIGDPVLISGGIDPLITDPIKASAVVSETTQGSILDLNITNGGRGYRIYPDSKVEVYVNGVLDSNSDLTVSLVDTSNAANVAILTTESIANQLSVLIGDADYNFDVSANANSNLYSVFSFTQFFTYPITKVNINESGSFYAPPDIMVKSTFYDKANTCQDLATYGILAPIVIQDGGTGYANTDTIQILGGDGLLAFAQIDSVTPSGEINAVSYFIDSNTPYTLGGMGYTNENLPSVVVTSGTGSGAILTIPGILGTGVEYELTTDTIGGVTKITLLESGEDYSFTPNVSLRIEDIVVSNVLISLENTIVYQGADQNTATYIAYVDSTSLLSEEGVGVDDNQHILRVYDYKGVPDTSSPLNVVDTSTNTIVTQVIPANTYNNTGFINGLKIYGDGKAKATAKFLNGLIIDGGRYLNTDGFVSEHQVLQSTIYNNYTYFLETENDYDTYKEILMNVVHPVGSQVISKNLLKSNTSFDYEQNSAIQMGNTYNNFSANLVLGSGNYSNTIILLPNTSIANVNSHIRVEANTNLNVSSKIIRVDEVNNTIYLEDFTQHKWPNVYSGYTSSNTVVITLENYATGYNINSFISLTDTLSIGNNSQTVIGVSNNVVYFTGDLFESGNSTNPTFITISKSLLSNNITILD